MNIGHLADKAEIAYSSALDLWHGRAQRISLAVMNRLCNALECTPCDLFDYEPGEMTETGPMLTLRSRSGYAGSSRQSGLTSG
jgi:DNA-binding Xre family transcriptional regulator